MSGVKKGPAKRKRCCAIAKRTNSQCSKTAIVGLPYCWSHYPKGQSVVFVLIGAVLSTILPTLYDEFTTSTEEKGIIDLVASDDVAKEEKFLSDRQVAALYKTEISEYLLQFRMFLHWSLPLGEEVHTRADEVFRYSRGIGKDGVDLSALDRQVVIDILETYDFTGPMMNYAVVGEARPTGLNHIIGNMERLGSQLRVHLGKYGSSISIELATRLEYAEALAKASVDAIRLDLLLSNTLSLQTIEGISDLVVQLRDDFLWVTRRFGHAVYPRLVGKVLVAHPEKGEILVQWPCGEYVGVGCPGR